MPEVDVTTLAELKDLDPDRLRSFGLEDDPRGVRMRYVAADGTPRRSRLRLGRRGVDGTVWAEDEEHEAGVYANGPAWELVRDRGFAILVEGESDCWIAWTCGLPALGLPNADGHRLLGPADLDGVAAVFISQESGDPRTFPDGIDRYVADVARSVHAVAPATRVARLSYPPDVEDLSGLWTGDEGGLLRSMIEAIAHAADVTPLDPTGTGPA